MTNLQTTAKPLILDPSLLGRPVHRLPHFAAQLREDMTAQLRQPAVRRYWGNVTVEGAAFSRLDGTEERVRWQYYATGNGVLGFALERKVLLSVLNNRYGRGKDSETPVDEAAVRVTATEERLAVVLGQQMAAVVAQRIVANLPGKDLPGSDASASQEVTPVKGPYPPKGTWIVTVNVRLGETEGKVWFTLDKNLMSDVLRGVSPERDTGKKASKQSGPLAQRMQVALNGRLVSKEVTLGALFDLRVGDVIPVSLHRADVMLEDSRLFTAAVTEHKGKLCLTSFEDVE